MVKEARSFLSNTELHPLSQNGNCIQLPEAPIDKPILTSQNGHLDQQELENNIIAQYEPFVLHIVGRLKNVLSHNHIAKEDAYQEGVLGLLEAIDGYNKSIGDFLPYAYKRIRGQILDFTRRQRPLSRPDHEKLAKIRSFEDRFVVKHERAPTGEEIAQSISISAEDVRWLHQFRTHNISDLSKKEQTAIDKDYHPALTDPDPLTSPENFLEIKEQTEQLNRAIQLLSPQQKAVLYMHYSQELRFWEIGQHLGISESGAAQLQKRALKRMKEYYQMVTQEESNGHSTNGLKETIQQKPQNTIV